MYKGERLDSKEAREWLRKNEEFFHLVERAFGKPYIQIPTVEDPKKVSWDTLFPEFARLRDIGIFCVIKARFLFHFKREREAIELLFNTAEMGKKLMESPRPAGLIGYLVGNAITDMSYKALRDLISKSHLPPSQLLSLTKRFLAGHSNLESDSWKRSVEMKYMVLRNMLDAFLPPNPYDWSKRKWSELRENYIEEKSIPGYLHPYFRFLYKPNKTRKTFFSVYNRAKENMGELYKNVKFVPLYQEDEFLIRENALERFIIENFTPYSEFFLTLLREYLRVFNGRATACLFALKAYKEEKGRLPNSLSELVPKYLPKIPIDPFDGKPLRYSKEKGIIYCVGRDLKDSGGSPTIGEGAYGTYEPPLLSMDDPTVKIGFK